MPTKSNSPFFPVLVVLFCCQMAASAQVLRTASEIGLVGLEDSVMKINSGSSVKKPATTINTVLPIPPSGLVQLSGFSYDRYKVLDSQGELWIAGPGTRDQTIDLGHLPSGIYYLHLSTAQGEVVSKVLLDSKVIRE